MNRQKGATMLRAASLIAAVSLAGGCTSQQREPPLDFQVDAYNQTRPGPPVTWSLPDGFSPSPSIPRPASKYYLELLVRNESGRDVPGPSVVEAFFMTTQNAPVLEM